jgi:hypothetical protein
MTSRSRSISGCALDHQTAWRMPHKGLEGAPRETQAPLDSLVWVGRTRHENRGVGQSAPARERRQFPLHQLR